MKLLKNTCLYVFFMLAVQISSAQNSYIFIELVKTIPCKVLQNGHEVMQLNKNFVVLDITDGREQNIDIEFGANLYPPQKFVVDAMPNAAYAYKLAKSGESTFYLLDLVNNGKIIESNSAVNMGLSTDLNTINFGKNQLVRKNVVVKKAKTENWVQKLKRSKPKTKIVTIKKPAAIKKEARQPEKKLKKMEEVESQPPQYGVIEVLKSNVTVAESPTQKKENNKGNDNKQVTVKPIAQMKTNCNLVASDREIESFIEKINAKTDDDTKLLILRKKQFTGCLSVTQVKRIAENFATQYGKYNLVRITMPNIKNPEDLMQCESLFKTEGYRNKFYLLVDPQK